MTTDPAGGRMTIRFVVYATSYGLDLIDDLGRQR